MKGFARLKAGLVLSFMFGAICTASAQTELTKIRASTIPTADSAAFEVARAKGYFAEEGLDIDPTPLVGGAAGIPALMSGQLQVASTNIVSAILAASQGLDIVIIAAGNSTGPNPPDFMGLMAAPNTPLKTGKDFEGKKIAVNTRNNIIWLYARQWVESTGGDPNKVTYSEVPFPQMGDALQQGRVDAAMMVEPFLSSSVKGGVAANVAWPYNAVQKNLPVAEYVTTRAYADAHPGFAEKFGRAYAKGVDWANANVHSDAFFDILAGYTRIPAERMKEATMPVYIKGISVAELKQIAELMKHQGLLKQDVDVSRLLLPTTSKP
jgi:NitT/TauT family transport system substrate-binding protein